MAAYYNEIDPFAAAWLRNLITAGHIAPGDVDTRSIVDVSPSDLRGYTQCHFFAGIGVWSHALRRAGWDDDRPAWTGSCPCQPFSAAGKGGGFDDERHLWPAFHHLIGQCGPAVVFGEQVASKDADPWIDLVQTDMEALGYAFGAVPFPSAGIGAPHIRDRTYWLADAECVEHQERIPRLGKSRGPQRGGAAIESTGLRMLGGVEYGESDGRLEWWPEPGGRSVAGGRSLSGLDDDDITRLEGQRGRHQAESGWDGEIRPTATANEFGGMADSSGIGRRESRHRDHARNDGPQLDANGSYGGPTGPTNGLWRAADWLFCRDGKWRPVESGTFPLAHGAPARVGRLRGYGNAINAVAAETFITAYLEKDLVEIDAERLRLTGVFA